MKNGLEFRKVIKNVIVPEDHVLMSLDEKTLFTSIPLDLVIESVKNRWKIIEQHCKIPWEAMEAAIKLITTSIFFN